MARDGTFQSFRKERKKRYQCVVPDANIVKGRFLKEQLESSLKDTGIRLEVREVVAWFNYSVEIFRGERNKVSKNRRG